MRPFHIIPTIAAALVAIPAGTAAADSYTIGDPPPPPPPAVAEFVAPGDSTARSTTCEGNVSCWLLEGACELAGGTYTGWHSNDRGHDHEHGICTWPDR